MIANTTKKQANLAAVAAAVDNPDAVAPLVAELQSLAARKSAAERERDDLQRRIADAEAEGARVQTLID